MKDFSHVMMRCLILLTVLLFSKSLAGQSGVQENDIRHTIVFKQEMFALSAKPGQSVFQCLHVEPFDGPTIDSYQLPTKAKEGVVRFEKRVCAKMEFIDADPRTVIWHFTRKPPDRLDVRLGGGPEIKKRETEPSWFDDLSFGEKKLTCVATNVSLLDFAVIFADAFDCDFGVTADGEVLFRNKTADAIVKHPIYVITSRGARGRQLAKSPETDSGKSITIEPPINERSTPLVIEANPQSMNPNVKVPCSNSPAVDTSIKVIKENGETRGLFVPLLVVSLAILAGTTVWYLLTVRR